MCRRCYESFSAVTEIDWESELGGWSLCYHSWVGKGISQKQTQTVPVYHVDDSLGGQREAKEEQEEANYSLLCQVENFIRFSCWLSTLPASK